MGQNLDSVATAHRVGSKHATAGHSLHSIHCFAHTEPSLRTTPIVSLARIPFVGPAALALVISAPVSLSEFDPVVWRKPAHVREGGLA